MTIYAVVRIDNEPHANGCTVYTKQSSNFNKIKEYKKEISAKYPTSKVYLMTREKAQATKKRYANWYKKYEALRWEMCYQKALMENF